MVQKKLRGIYNVHLSLFFPLFYSVLWKLKLGMWATHVYKYVFIPGNKLGDFAMLCEVFNCQSAYFKRSE